MKQSIEKIIKDTASVTATEIINQQRQSRPANLYRAMERLLRNYKSLRKLALSPEEYGFIPPQRSCSVTVAPPTGGGTRDRDDVLEEAILSRRASYERTRARFEEIDSVVRQFQDKEEFVVIRMYYFNEDAYGDDRSPEAKPYTFEQISDELSAAGLRRSERTLRSWRTRLVQDMTVLLFGTEGAVSIEAREPKQGQKESDDAQT